MKNIYDVLSKDNGILLGKDIYLPIDKRGNINSLLVGGSGSGKHAGFVLPNILNMLGSYVIIDKYGEIYQITNKYLEENGYEIKTINIENSKHNYNYDPISHINNDYDVDNLVEILIGDNSDEFWNESAKALIKTVIYYVLEKAEKKDLLTVYYLLATPKEILFEKFNEFDEGSKGYKYSILLKTFPEKTYASVVSTAITKISFIIDRINDDRSFQKEIDFSDMKKKKMALFIGANEIVKSEIKIDSIMISQIFSQLSAKVFDDNFNEKVYFLLNDIEIFSKIEYLKSAILMSRSNNLSIHLITNNINFLKKLYGDEFYSIINTIDTQMLLGTNLKSDYEYFEELFGEEIIRTNDEFNRDKVLIFEKGLNKIVADKDYYFQNEKWNNI